MSINGEYIKRAVAVIGIITATVLLTWFFIRAVNVLLMVFAATVLAVPLTWMADWGRDRLKMPRWLSLTVSVLLLLSTLGGLGAVTVPTIMSQGEVLVENLMQSIEDLKGILGRFAWGRELVSTMEKPSEFFQGPQGDYSGAASRILGIFSNTLNAVTWPLLVILISIYFSSEPSMYINGFVRLLPPMYRERAKDVFRHLGHILRWWLFGQGISMLILGVGTTILLWILNIPLAFLLGLVTAFMTFIPILGPILAGIPILLIALTVSPGRAVIVGLFYLVLQNLEGSFITPTVHRRIIAMPPVLIISIQIVLASIIGFVGVLLAMPLVACGMVLVQMVYIEDMLEGGMRKYTEKAHT